MTPDTIFSEDDSYEDHLMWTEYMILDFIVHQNT